MRTQDAEILETMEYLENHSCRKCKIHYVVKKDDLCDLCIDEIINEEGGL